MFTEVITQTETINQGAPSLLLRGHGRAPLNYIQLDPEEEQYIASRIEIFRSQGANEQSLNWMMDMLAGGTLSAETQAQIKEWVKEYFTLDPSDTESLSLAIAILIIKILIPALDKENEEGQDLLLDWEETGKDILFLFLVDEDVDTFLKECEEQLDQEDILKSICSIADEALKKLNQTYQELFLRHDQQIDQACEAFKARLQAIQNNREQGSDAIAADVNRLINDIEQLAEKVINTAIEDSEGICDKLDTIQMASDRQFEELRNVIKKI